MSRGLQVFHISKISFFRIKDVVCLLWVVEPIITMEDVMKKSRPVLSKTFTSALADMDPLSMDEFVISKMEVPDVKDAQNMLDEHMLLSVEEIEERVSLICSFVLSRGQSGTTDWLSNFLIDNCMPKGKFSPEVAFMSSEIMRIALGFKRIKEQMKPEEE